MNRVIKFRAWHTVVCEMLNWDKLKNLRTAIKNKDVILMQFTGLVDKNGVEIYEGDFDKDFQVVRWCDKKSGYAMSIYDFPTKEHICCHCYNCEGNYDISEVISELEVIGNIHEHKHLLI